MANSLITKRMLAQSLKELVQEIPLEKITIADICRKHNMNRKSFYYHFKDKYDLLKFIFRSEFAAEFPEARPAGDGSAGVEFFRRLCHYLYENREFYRRVFRPHQHNYFMLHFSEEIRGYIEARVTSLMDGDSSEFCISFLSDGTTGAIQRWITGYNPMRPQEVVAQTESLLERIGMRLHQEKR